MRVSIIPFDTGELALDDIAIVELDETPATGSMIKWVTTKEGHTAVGTVEKVYHDTTKNLTEVHVGRIEIQ